MFFFFKQKTAYEMRISDWSSDVCSSDLQIRSPIHVAPPARHAHLPSSAVSHRRTKRRKNLPLPRGLHLHSGELPRERGIIGDGPVRQRRFARSEEHTSELQSLMRISYAVLCLKKKTN